jgi:toxin ParE1/3/4
VDVRFNEAARRELIDAVNYYDRQVGGLGEELFSEVQWFVALLIANPLLGKRVPDGRRAVVMNRFPYQLIYRLDEVGVRIVAVSHQKRHPDYWRGRVEEAKPRYANLRQAA